MERDFLLQHPNFEFFSQEAADVMMEALKAIPGQIGQYCLFTVETCAYATRYVIGPDRFVCIQCGDSRCLQRKRDQNPENAGRLC